MLETPLSIVNNFLIIRKGQAKPKAINLPPPKHVAIYRFKGDNKYFPVDTLHYAIVHSTYVHRYMHT